MRRYSLILAAFGMFWLTGGMPASAERLTAVSWAKPYWAKPGLAVPGQRGCPGSYSGFTQGGRAWCARCPRGYTFLGRKGGNFCAACIAGYTSIYLSGKLWCYQCKYGGRIVGSGGQYYCSKASAGGSGSGSGSERSRECRRLSRIESICRLADPGSAGRAKCFAMSAARKRAAGC